ncbi:MAG: chromosomal replication initiator protein DnaA [Alphaproteobacteria bacterium]|nr:chromosomal replication initiator protein DnaA [Alphaproteobacteria bacterium]
MLAEQIFTTENETRTRQSLGNSGIPSQSEWRSWLSMWQRVTMHLQAELGEDIFSSWFARVSLENVQDMRVALSVPTPFLKNWIRTHYMVHLLKFWKAENNKIIAIDLWVRGRGHVSSGQDRAVPLRPARPIMLPGSSAAVASSEAVIDIVSSRLEPRYTLSTFVVGQSNAMAHQAVQGLFTKQSSWSDFNILYVHGAVGLGKTHLLQAATHEARTHSQKSPDKIVYLTAERFMYRFISALKANDALAFKKQLRSIELLLIDDLQFLQGKATQQEFCHTLNELIGKGQQIIIAADRSPSDLDSFDDRMRSRLSGGLLLPITPFDASMRLDILRHKLRGAQQRFPKLLISEETLMFISERIQGNGRDLEGAFNRLLAHHQFNQTEITIPVAEGLVRDLVQNVDPKRVRIEQIQRVVAKHFNISRQELISSRRSRAIVYPRQICMYLAKTMTDRSLPEIGRRFGGRDHTTVLHAIRKIENMKQDEVISRKIDLLRQMAEE